MSLLAGWRGWRAFNKLPKVWREIVVYSESGQDWHQFSGLIEALNESFERRVCYVTSDASDPGLQRSHERYRAVYLPEGFFLTLFFQTCRCDLFVLTMMDLGNLHLKRSVHPVHYVYVFHSMGSTHMVDHAESFDHYDTLFCAGPQQMAEIRRREELKGLPPKQLFEFGHPRLEEVMRAGENWRQGRGAVGGEDLAGKPPIVLVAPTWGDSSIFNVCGVPLIEGLLGAGFEVIMRPHYQSNRLTPEVISGVRDRFAGHQRFTYIDRMGETDSLLRSDLLISDWSAMALEYALGLEKPVLFIDVPRRVRNPDWRELGIEPLESAIRHQVGRIVSPQDLAQVPDAIRQLLADREAFRSRMRELRQDIVFNLGHSIETGAAELARLAEQQIAARGQQVALDG
ncbi:CDP-glycerol glycerophosphotransferase family protein [Elongatibacter sediminis]|uniref:CDP-glycerol glycerophosphotransferase family protein n=1 Tax=Elongatibacter sediminis TaxID=3119006 RepID=A0AAW9RLV5_9GAMM